MYSNTNESTLNELIESFIHQDISAPVFEKEYMAIWRKYRDSNKNKNTQVQSYMDSIFTALDIYCSDPRLREEGDFNDEELLNEVIKIKKHAKISI